VTAPPTRKTPQAPAASFLAKLTEAEASFRALKSELLVRPLFHQLEPGVKAHVVVAFLGYGCGSRSNNCRSVGQ